MEGTKALLKALLGQRGSSQLPLRGKTAQLQSRVEDFLEGEGGHLPVPLPLIFARVACLHRGSPVRTPGAVRELAGVRKAGASGQSACHVTSRWRWLPRTEKNACSKPEWVSLRLLRAEEGFDTFRLGCGASRA